MSYKRRWKQSSLAERHYTGRLYTPINQDEAVFNDKIGRIWLRVFPTGAGPIYRFRAEFRFCYPSGLVINYFPDDSLRELERAVRKARKVVRKWERFQSVNSGGQVSHFGGEKWPGPLCVGGGSKPARAAAWSPLVRMSLAASGLFWPPFLLEIMLRNAL